MYRVRFSFINKHMVGWGFLQVNVGIGGGGVGANTVILTWEQQSHYTILHQSLQWIGRLGEGVDCWG